MSLQPHDEETLEQENNKEHERQTFDQIHLQIDDFWSSAVQSQVSRCWAGSQTQAFHGQILLQIDDF